MAWRVAVVVLVLAPLSAVGYWFLRPYLEPPPLPPPPVLKAAPEKKGPEFPIGADAKPLPKLGESDPILREQVANLVDPKALAKFFN